MRILYITTIGETMRFFSSLIEELVRDGNTIDIATNECGGETPVNHLYKNLGCRVYPISCSRSPFDAGNFKAIEEIREIVKNGGFDIVHCHTPIAAACTRLACKPLRKNGVKVIYTAHGFHFYKGAPKKNWLVYYPVEWLCSFWTDVLITINKEDFARAKKHLHAKRVKYVPGVGIDVAKFAERGKGRGKIRAEFGIKDNQKVLLSVGELNENKNHESVIRAIAGLDLVYIVVGRGELENKLRAVADEVGANVILTGFRADVADFYDAADAYILSSFREGLNVSLMEAMASALPCLCGRIRGNTDLIDENGGYLFDPHSVEEIRQAVKAVLQKSDGMGSYNLQKVKKFDIHVVNRMIRDIYQTQSIL